MADEDTPAEGAPAEGAPVEGTPVEDAPIEDAPAEDAPAEGTSVADAPVEDAPAADTATEDAAAETGSPDDGGTGGSEPRWRTARVAAVVAGAVLTSAAAITGAVWAISAIIDDDDDYRDFGDYAMSIDPDMYPEELRGAEKDWGPRPDRDRGERAERRRGERFDRERDERFDRDWDERAERDRRGAGRERKERSESEESYGSKKPDDGKPDPAAAAEGCVTILSLGTGDDAVTVLVCNAPGAEWPGFEPGGDGGYFRFRQLPRDAFRFFPFSDPGGERLPFGGGLWPFGPGMAPWDRDGRPLEDGLPFENRRPFDREEFREEFEGFFENRRPFESRPFESEQFFERFLEEFDQFFENGLPFDFESDSEGGNGGIEDFFEDFFGDGDRGFRFRGDGGDGSQDSFCFRDGDEGQCFSDLGQLSDEEREQLERMMEMLDGFGLGGILGELLDSLDDLELEFSESQTDPAGVSGA